MMLYMACVSVRTEWPCGRRNVDIIDKIILECVFFKSLRFAHLHHNSGIAKFSHSKFKSSRNFGNLDGRAATSIPSKSEGTPTSYLHCGPLPLARQLAANCAGLRSSSWRRAGQFSIVGYDKNPKSNFRYRDREGECM